MTGLFASGALSTVIAILLVISSFWLWAAIWRCFAWLRRVRKANQVFKDNVWAEATNLHAAAQVIEERGPRAPMEAGFVAGMQALQDSTDQEEPTEILWRIERRMRTAAQGRFETIRRDVSMMSIVASAAPLAGLLGTVLGIVSAFMALSESGGGDIAAVAPGLAEALGTTGLGLLAAIPAVITGQYIRSAVGRMEREFRAFTDEMVILVRRALHAG